MRHPRLMPLHLPQLPQGSRWPARALQLWALGGRRGRRLSFLLWFLWLRGLLAPPPRAAQAVRCRCSPVLWQAVRAAKRLWHARMRRLCAGSIACSTHRQIKGLHRPMQAAAVLLPLWRRLCPLPCLRTRCKRKHSVRRQPPRQMSERACLLRAARRGSSALPFASSTRPMLRRRRLALALAPRWLLAALRCALSACRRRMRGSSRVSWTCFARCTRRGCG